MNRRMFYVILSGIITQLFFDGLLYCVWFSSGNGYAAHFMGFVSGFLLCLIIGSTSKTSGKYTFYTRLVALIFLSLLVAYIAYSFINTWPPYSHYELPLHPGATSKSCCKDYYSLIYNDNMQESDILSQYYCNGDHLSQYGQ